ncbi:MAG TPA: hypothetical protein VKV24_08820 [Casimicrobiaceae bacterium]|nr:hypothetical protein [Casimicrobiaceae bacterium]
MPARGRRLRIAAALTAAALPLCALGEPFYGADVRVAHDDNLTLASASADRLGDGFATVAGHLGQFFVLENDDSVSLQAGASARTYARYSLLDSVSIDASAQCRRKLGLGLTAPWIVLRVDATHENVRDDIRDSDMLLIAFETGLRVNERLDVSGGYVHDGRFAKNAQPVVPGISGAIYDNEGDSVFARAGYAITPSVLVDGELRVRRGDVVATTPESLPIFLASSAIAPDPAFGPNRYGYRVRGTTRSASLAMSYAVDARSAVNVGYTFAWTSAPAGVDYRSNIVSASFVWRY